MAKTERVKAMALRDDDAWPDGEIIGTIRRERTTASPLGLLWVGVPDPALGGRSTRWLRPDEDVEILVRMDRAARSRTAMPAESAGHSHSANPHLTSFGSPAGIRAHLLTLRSDDGHGINKHVVDEVPDASLGMYHQAQHIRHEGGRPDPTPIEALNAMADYASIRGARDAIFDWNLSIVREALHHPSTPPLKQIGWRYVFADGHRGEIRTHGTPDPTAGHKTEAVYVLDEGRPDEDPLPVGHGPLHPAMETVDEVARHLSDAHRWPVNLDYRPTMQLLQAEHAGLHMNGERRTEQIGDPLESPDTSQTQGTDPLTIYAQAPPDADGRVTVDISTGTTAWVVNIMLNGQPLGTWELRHIREWKQR